MGSPSPSVEYTAQPNKSPLSPSRDGSIDLIKTIAILGVIVIHSCTTGYFKPLGSFDWTSSIFWGAVSRASVPLFFMCSGALLLGSQKKLTLRRLFGKNILRVLLAMFLWATLYKVDYLQRLGTLSWESFGHALKEILLFKQEFHFYYIHIILLVYLCLPITRVFVQHATKAQLEYALAIWFVFAILYPTLKPFWPFHLLQGIPAQWLLNMSYASIGYGVLGFYLKTYPPSRRVAWLSLGVGVSLVFFGTIFLSLRYGESYMGFFEGMSVGTALYALGIFSLCQRHTSALTTVGQSVTAYCSKASFCIYLVHVFFLFRLNEYPSPLPNLVSIPLLTLIILAASLLLYALLSRFPFFSRWFL